MRRQAPTDARRPVASGSGVPADGWMRFEARARERHLERRAAAARAAMGQGRLDEAREAIAEIRATLSERVLYRSWLQWHLDEQWQEARRAIVAAARAVPDAPADLAERTLASVMLGFPPTTHANLLTALVTGASRGIGRGIAIELAKEVGVPVPAATLVAQLEDALVAAGRGGDDLSALAHQLRRMADALDA